jgi:hypothetical protein
MRGYMMRQFFPMSTFEISFFSSLEIKSSVNDSKANINDNNGEYYE